MVTWEILSEIKESSSSQVVEYTCGNVIIEETEFVSWEPYILKKQKAIIDKVKLKFWDRTHKYGIDILKSTK